MIYLFDREKKLQKIIPRKHIINATQTKVRNGIYQLAVEVPIFYEDKKGTQYNYQKSVSKAEFAGHYDDKNRFQLYKIYSRNITANEQGEFLLFDGVHIFFDEAKAMGNIHDRRFRDSEAKSPADVAFNSIGWTVTDYDVTDRHDINFYRASVTDAWNDLISAYGVEFDYELQFDGRKIISKNIVMKKQIGKWTGQRFAYGTNVLTLTQEQDESEVYTAAVGRGRGEETGDGFGPRLEFGDITWSKDGITKPVGQNYIELPSATAEYGFIENGIVKPRIAPEVVFEDIEDKKELADATYYWLLENCLPKATWKTEVARIGNLNLGDTVGVLYKAAGIIKRARVEKIEHNLLDPKLSKLTLGDYRYFNQDKRQQRIDSTINRIQRESNSRITQMKKEYTAWFDAQTLAIKNAYEQAVIDANANIQAAEERMEALITTTRNDWTDTFEAEVAEIYRKADEDYNRIETEITGVIDSTRNDMETEFNESVQSTRAYAEQQAAERADAVQSNLESATSEHQGMIDDLQRDVLDIDDFIGANRNITLDQRLLDMTQDFDQRIRNSTRDASNMLRGSRFDEPSMFNQNFVGVSLHTSEHENFIRLNTVQSDIPLVIMNGELHLHAGVEYHLHIEYRTDTVTELDGFVFYHNNGTTERLENRGLAITGLTTSGAWEHASMTLSPNAEMSGRLAIGTRRNYGTSPDGIIDVRLPYLTTTAHDQWLPHPRDENQNITEISRRITDLEDGYSDFIVRSVWDAEMNSLNQTIRDYQTTVDGVEDTIIQLQNSDVITRGREVIDTVDGFSRKVWLGDIDRPNLIPFADVLRETNRDEWIGRGSRFNGSNSGLTIVQADSLGNYIGMESPKIYDYVESGETYTLSWEGHHLSGYQLSDSFDYVYLVGMSGNNIRLYNIQRTAVSGYTNRYHYTATFEMPSTITENTRILFGVLRDGESGGLAYVRFGKPKLELGTISSPFETSYSMLEQRADSIALQVDDQESRIADFTVDLDGIIGTVADIEGDMVKQSSLEITSDYAQIGSMRIDGDTVGSLLRVSPDGIDAIASAMRLSGDLYVDGDITALAVDAIEGNFARLWADEFSAITIDADDIQGLTARFEWLYTLNANIERLVSQNVFANGVNALVGNFVDVNAGNIVTSGLSANIIMSSHINSSNALIEKLFSNSARIDTLVSKTHFVNEIKATSIEAVYANISDLRTKLLTSDVILSKHVNASNAIIDKLFSEDAYISRLTSKSAFIRDIQAIEITANQLNINTLQNKLGSVEGGLYIYGPDGRVLINNSILRASFDVQIRPNHASSAVRTTGINFVTNSDSWQTFEHFYTDHKGSQLLVSWALSLQSGNSSSEYIEVRTRGFGGYNPIGTETLRRTVSTSGTTYYNQVIDLGVPNYNGIQGYLEFRRDPNGTSTSNNVMARVLRVSLIN